MALHVLDEANRCLGCKKPLCQQGCPIHTNIPEVIRLLKANQMDEAGRMLFENNPLTTVCALVCNHENQCEGHCVRNPYVIRILQLGEVCKEAVLVQIINRSEERRVGKECTSWCRSRWSPYH